MPAAKGSARTPLGPKMRIIHIPKKKLPSLHLPQTLSMYCIGIVLFAKRPVFFTFAPHWHYVFFWCTSQIGMSNILENCPIIFLAISGKSKHFSFGFSCDLPHVKNSAQAIQKEEIPLTQMGFALPTLPNRHVRKSSLNFFGCILSPFFCEFGNSNYGRTNILGTPPYVKFSVFCYWKYEKCLESP